MNIKNVILITPIVTLQCYGMSSFQESLPASNSDMQSINNNMHISDTNKLTSRTISPRVPAQAKQISIQRTQEIGNQSQRTQTSKQNFRYIPQHFSYPDPSVPIYQCFESTPQPITQPGTRLKQVIPQEITEVDMYSFEPIFRETEQAGEDKSGDEFASCEEEESINEEDAKHTLKIILPKREKSCCERCMRRIRELYGKMNIWAMFSEVSQKAKSE